MLPSPDIYDWIFLVLGLGIYFDATHHNIGKIKEFHGFFNRAAGTWAAAASFTYIGLIAVIFYIIHRRKLIDDAAIHPVELGITHRILVAALLFILPMFLTDLLPSFAVK